MVVGATVVLVVVVVDVVGAMVASGADVTAGSVAGALDARVEGSSASLLPEHAANAATSMGASRRTGRFMA